MAIGGGSRDVTDWLAVVGLVRQEVHRVAVESQRGSVKAPRLRAWSTFPWKAFTINSRRSGDLPNTVTALDVSGRAMQEIDLGYTYESPCQDRRGPLAVGGNRPNGCKRRRRLRPWSAERDPIAEAQAPRINGRAGSRSKRLAVDHPTVRGLVTSQAFSIGPVALWSKCNRGPIGAIVPIRLTTPVSFEGDVPLREYDPRSRTAYLEGIAHVRARGMLSLMVAVDLNRRTVVGIEFLPADFQSGTGRGSQPTIETRIVRQPQPAGGPDSGNCAQKGD